MELCDYSLFALSTPPAWLLAAHIRTPTTVLSQSPQPLHSFLAVPSLLTVEAAVWVLVAVAGDERQGWE